MHQPLEVVCRIGEKLIRETPFAWGAQLAAVPQKLDGLQCVNFARTFGLGRRAAAFAWTRLHAAEEMTLVLQLEHNDGCSVWLDGRLIHHLAGERPLRLRHDERGTRLSHEVSVRLTPGFHTLLIRSVTAGREWAVYLQPPGTQGAVLTDAPRHAGIGLREMSLIDERIAAVSNWLVLGPFAEDAAEGMAADLVQMTRQEVRFGVMFPGLDGPVTWTIPKVEILGAMIHPRPWGTNYDWNYHNGGVAWAMQELARASGDPRYADYAARFCDFHLAGQEFVRHQVHTLRVSHCANRFLVDTPLLDFTLAPSMPILRRLILEPDFPNRAAYARWVERMLRYALEEQIRLPGHGIFTRTTPVKYTTWVDDMFMGIPFLVHAAQFVADPATRRTLLDDAAQQVLGFNTQVWDEEARLYMHARYSGNPIKLPHWSRCNGWASWAMCEVLEHLPPTHPQRVAILRHFQIHCASLLRFQHPSGLWPNVLDHADSALEVSGTAIFTLALARGVRQGWLEAAQYRPAALRAWHGLESRIESDGTVHDICMGTMCSEDVRYYLERPFYDDDTHGLFAVLFAGLEIHRLNSPASS